MNGPGEGLIAGAPPGFDALVLGRLAEESDCDILFVAETDVRLAQMDEALAYFAPGVTRLVFPAWDCLPYDRVSPRAEIVSRRLHTLSRLAVEPRGGGRIVLATVSAITQRVPPREAVTESRLALRKGGSIAPETLIGFLEHTGYRRVETVMEPGDFAVRGGIVDVFAASHEEPVRLDFFGDELDGIRTFDVDGQRTTGTVDSVTLTPGSEVILNDATAARFRASYRALFGPKASDDDPLYASISERRAHAGMEHWLPLFYSRLETLFDYMPDARVILDHKAPEACEARWEIIADHHAARREFGGTRFAEAAAPYHPAPPERMFLLGEAWDAALEDRSVGRLSPFAAPEADRDAVDCGGRPGVTFAEARVRGDVNLFDALADRLKEYRARRAQVIFAAASNGTRDRLLSVLKEHGLTGLVACDTWTEARAAKQGTLPFIVLPLDQGFQAPEFTVIAEPDVLGDRLTRHTKRHKRPDNFLKEATALSAGDLVVHIDHGIGRYDGLETINAGGAPHDCLKLTYAGEDRLYLPVENIEMVSRYGSESDGVTLDRLGGAAWQARKAKLKDRVKAMADELIKLAAARTMHKAPAFATADGAFDEFCARFPYTETDDQNKAIGDVLADLGRGMPADRLICGDVGFGKTEVALRAAFIAAMEGKQVAVVVPTTLLCRQHYRNFEERFRGFPMRIAELSRLVSARDAKANKAGIKDGTVDIVIGTHALLAKDIVFRDLSLLIVDEEQHFGVAHKERLKKLKADVHVLTLTATPIPRTLQMALTGVRDMSLIATPPVDRLAVRTFVTEFDPVVIREAMLREHYRGGQTFYVCPRIEDLSAVEETLAELVPELSHVTAHGRLNPKELETAIAAFYEGKYNVLLSTNIIESGLDLPSVNTIVIHRADMFGLGQLYQLRGRVGRGRRRAYAYLTLPPRKKLTAAAEKRLNVMQALDSLGAGFTLASHDLDIRGAGNLLGSEQSGHIREVGIELYQQMLEDAVAKAQSGEDQVVTDSDWSPQIALGVGVLIPDTYVPDLGVRLGLYRRLADIRNDADIDAFAAELVDRFGELPDEVNNLLEVVAIRNFCRIANVEKVDAGPKGAVVSFRNNTFARPEALIQFIGRQAKTCALRPDHRLVYKRVWERPGDRLGGVRRLVTDLARLAEGAAGGQAKRT